MSEMPSASHGSDPSLIVPVSHESPSVIEAVRQMAQMSSKEEEPRRHPDRAAALTLPKLSMRLEEELSDQRSNVGAYRFVVENHGSEPVEILKIDPRIPAGARLVKIENSAAIEAETRRARLTAELTELLRKVLFVKSEAFRELWLQQQKNQMDELFRNGRPSMKILAASLRGTLNERFKREFQTLQYDINSSEDAWRAFETWLARDQTSETREVSELFALKISQLHDAEKNIGTDRSVLAVIEPDSFFAVTYIYQFPRSVLEPRKFQIAVEVAYRQPGVASTHYSSTTKSLLVSPHPVSLSVVAVAASVLGVVVKTVLVTEKALAAASKGNPSASPVSLINTALTNAWYHGWFPLAAIIALVFFNVYEYTKLGKSVETIPVSWRSSLVIGFLCGVAYDKVIVGLQAFLG